LFFRYPSTIEEARLQCHELRIAGEFFAVIGSRKTTEMILLEGLVGDAQYPSSSQFLEWNRHY
jgi:hypothetical protein